MLTKVLKINFLFISFVIFLLFKAPEVHAEGDKPYLSQEYVDTMVQNAFYGFVQAAEYNGADWLQARAIEKAKKVATELKKLAKGDPNRRYVLWRVGELEQQIYYEEEEILLKKMYKNQKAINVLCEKFNVEVGKKRPSFSNLIAIHSSMLDLDPRKADELAWLIEDRDRNLSREVSFALERFLLFEAYDKAKKEYDYILKNRKYLFVSDEKFERFENRMRKKNEADNIMANIDKYYGDIVSEIKRTNIAGARWNIECFLDRINKVHTMLPYKEYSEYKQNINRLMERVAQKEDSLVYKNMMLLHANKVEEAIDYMENVLRKHGVSNGKIATVNNSILKFPGQKRITAADKSVDQELTVLASQQTENNGFTFGDVAAKTKAKMDSVRAYEAGQRRYIQSQSEKEHKKEIVIKLQKEKKQKKYRDKAKKDMLKIYTLLEDNNIDKAYLKFQTLKPSLKKYSSEGEFKGLEIAVVLSYEAEKNRIGKEEKNKRKAESVIRDLYALLEQKNVPEAYSKFNNLKTLLKKYSPDDAFLNLQNTVEHAYESFKREMLKGEKVKTETEVARATPVTYPEPIKKPAQVTTSAIAAKPSPVTLSKKPTQTTKTIKTTKVVQEEKVVVNEKATNEKTAAVKESFVSAGYGNEGHVDPYSAFDKKQHEAQEKATRDVVDIYSLLENRQARLAYEYFKKNQIPLKTYVPNEVYEVLESTVLRAYKDLKEVFE